MKLRFPLAIATFLLSMQISHAVGTTESLPVTGFHYYKSHIGLLIKQPAMINSDSCARSDWYILEKTHPYYKEIVALVMASHLNGQPLAFGVEGCVQGMPAIQHVVSNK